jgi:hypothetical protein
MMAYGYSHDRGNVGVPEPATDHHECSRRGGRATPLLQGASGRVTATITQREFSRYSYHTKFCTKAK